MIVECSANRRSWKRPVGLAIAADQVDASSVPIAGRWNIVDIFLLLARVDLESFV